MAQPDDSIEQLGSVGEQVAASFSGSVTKQYAYDYLLYLPKDYDAAKPVPLMIFLHGMGERGDNLELVKVHGPPKQIAAGKEFPCIVVSPQCPDDRVWSPDALGALVDHLQANLAVDKRRIYVTGLSMGGYGTWTLAARYPKRFAAAVPICGGASYFDSHQLVDLPIWCFHGGDDQVVPLSESQRLVDAIKRKGGKQVKLTVYEHVGHDSWTQTYDNQEVYHWLFSHSLPE